jgi:hypothetical protein
MQLLAVSAVIVLASFVTMQVMFVYSAPSLNGNITIGPYPSGYVIAGIKWDDSYVKLTIVATNNSDFDYNDFDLYISPSMIAEESGVAESVLPCTISYTGRQSIPSWIASIPVDGKLTTWDRFGNRPWRLHCEKFPKHSEISAVMALSDPTKAIPSAVYLDGAWTVKYTPNRLAPSGKVRTLRFPDPSRH